MRYFYTWLPLVAGGAAFILSGPWLAVGALLIAASVAVVALLAAVAVIVVAPYRLGRAIYRQVHVGTGQVPYGGLPVSNAASAQLAMSAVENRGTRNNLTERGGNVWLEGAER